MKHLKKVIILGLVTVTLLTANFLFRSEFAEGQCVKDDRDGYIWHINNYSLGKYRLMGWQGNAWGNEVEMKKGLLERKDLTGIPIYNQTVCPEFKPK